MKINGEIVFDIADIRHIEVDFGEDILSTKIIIKGAIVALGRTAPKNRWIYEIKFNDENEFLHNLELLIDRLCEKSEYVNQLAKIYEEVSINIYIRSDFAEIGYCLPSHIIKKISLLDCGLNFEILSFGMAISQES